MTRARPEDYAEEAEEILPGLVVAASEVKRRQETIAKALADAWNKGYRQGGQDR